MNDYPAISDGEVVHPLERLKQKAEEAEERREKEVVECPDCGTEVLKVETVRDALQTLRGDDDE